ncbi:hypothetical protein TMUPMC115_1783 [Tetragenococcus muriaticus PMC-11-5]|uniref:Uncharacterized protein n=1 Tax=Tetragenococcus muriaticus PMC-11-5 TaxID=1302649 RepID=A0A091C177_9ENTE|nr:hypothetical protein [Tetragenococcus muriaticus]KFN90709.1 hypothetical protein TMUPMC115_1783 [Tetragenococcus muriaticus PMC-11-5]
MTIIDTKKIRKLLNSDLTSYRVAQLTKVKQPVYYRYQKGQTPIENMTLKVASELMKIVEMEENTMDRMEILKFKNLMNTYANEDGTMDLEFQSTDKTVFIRNVEAEEAVNDEFYWDDKNNVQKAIDEADSEDIEEVE